MPKIPMGLRALQGKKVISWQDWHLATGLAITTLRQYKQSGELPPPEPGTASSWLTSREDVREYIKWKVRIGAGYRTDLHQKRKPPRVPPDLSNPFSTGR